MFWIKSVLFIFDKKFQTQKPAKQSEFKLEFSNQQNKSEIEKKKRN
jgi:hypothetical protein